MVLDGVVRLTLNISPPTGKDVLVDVHEHLPTSTCTGLELRSSKPISLQHNLRPHFTTRLTNITYSAYINSLFSSLADYYTTASTGQIWSWTRCFYISDWCAHGTVWFMRLVDFGYTWCLLRQIVSSRAASWRDTYYPEQGKSP